MERLLYDYDNPYGTRNRSCSCADCLTEWAARVETLKVKQQAEKKATELLNAPPDVRAAPFQ